MIFDNKTSACTLFYFLFYYVKKNETGKFSSTIYYIKLTAVFLHTKQVYLELDTILIY